MSRRGVVMLPGVDSFVQAADIPARINLGRREDTFKYSKEKSKYETLQCKSKMMNSAL